MDSSFIDSDAARDAPSPPKNKAWPHFWFVFLLRNGGDTVFTNPLTDPRGCQPYIRYAFVGVSGSRGTGSWQQRPPLVSKISLQRYARICFATREERMFMIMQQ
jgi:hypothetical protein